jgi:hypothetical protein
VNGTAPATLKTVKEFKLKKWEKEILLHRLELTDALEECLGAYQNGSDPEDEFKGFEEEELRLAIGIQLEYVQHGCLALSPVAPEIEKAVLADLLEGSTWFSGHDEAIATGEISRSMGQRHIKAAKNLEKMISELAGREVSIQWH